MRRQQRTKIITLLCCMMFTFLLIPSFHVYDTFEKVSHKGGSETSTIAEIKEQVNTCLVVADHRGSRTSKDVRKTQNNRELFVLLLCPFSCYIVLHRKNKRNVLLYGTHLTYFHRQLAVLHQIDGKKRF